MIYLIDCKNLCKCYNVPPPSTTVEKIKTTTKQSSSLPDKFILKSVPSPEAVTESFVSLDLLRYISSLFCFHLLTNLQINILFFSNNGIMFFIITYNFFFVLMCTWFFISIKIQFIFVMTTLCSRTRMLLISFNNSTSKHLVTTFGIVEIGAVSTQLHVKIYGFFFWI
jgi:hypothetical protein